MTEAAPEQRGPTPETKRKVKEGMISILARRKDRSGSPFLWPEHIEAAEWIEDGYRAQGNKLATRLMKFEEPGYLHRRPEFIANTTARLIDLMHNYFNWTEELVQQGDAIMQAITMDVVIDNARPRYLERKYAIGSGRAKYLLRDGLERYALMTGRLTAGTGSGSKPPHSRRCV
jgi:hypothetical protein